MFCALNRLLGAIFATLTFETQHNLLGGLSLLVKHGLGLSSKTRLLSVVTTLSLCKLRGLSRLVLGDLEPLVGLALDVGAKGALAFRDVHLRRDD